MSKKSLKPLCALLALSLFSGAVACGSEETSDEIETTAGSNGTTTADAEETLTSGVPDDVDLGGATITVLNAPQYENFLPLMNAPEETGDTMNDAAYKRNIAVMDKLNVDLQILDYDYDKGAKDVYLRQLVLAGGPGLRLYRRYTARACKGRAGRNLPRYHGFAVCRHR